MTSNLTTIQAFEESLYLAKFDRDAFVIDLETKCHQIHIHLSFFV